MVSSPATDFSKQHSKMASSTPVQSSQRSGGPPSSSGGSPTYLEVPPRSHVETLLAQFLSGRADESADENADVSAEVTALAEASDRLLHAIQGLGSNEAAALMEADPAVSQVGPSRGPSLAGSSKRLLALIQNVANHPDSSVAADPAVVRLSARGRARGPTEGQAAGAPETPLSLGDREILRDASELRASYREKARKLLLIIRSLPPRPRRPRSPSLPKTPPSSAWAPPTAYATRAGPRGARRPPPVLR